jgi:hypothetical protein
VSDPHHHARGFDRACHCNMNRSDVVNMTSNGSNPVINPSFQATKNFVMALS